MRGLGVVLVLAALVVATHAQERDGIAASGSYDLVGNWMQPPEPGYLLHPVAHFAQTADRIFIASSGATRAATAPPTLSVYSARVEGAKADHHFVVVNKDGRVVERWTQWYDRLRSPHAVKISPYDSAKHVWIADRASHQVLKFTNDGKTLVLAVGTRGVAGNDSSHLGAPTDIAFLPDGSFLVTDGENADPQRRVVKYAADGQFITTWSAQEGQLAGFESNSVHGISVDARKRVYVAHRGSGRNADQGRVLIFDETGKYLEQWNGFKGIERVHVGSDGFVWVQEGSDPDHSLIKLDASGKRLASWLSRGTDISVDPDGNLYIQAGTTIADGKRIPGGRIEKYVPRKGASKNSLVATAAVAR